MSTRGIRNKNLGNLRRGSKWYGLVGTDDKGFCVFRSFDCGVRALSITLRTYIEKHGLRNIADIISRYAPPSENNTTSYISFVSHYVSTNGGTYDGIIYNMTDFQLLICAIIIYENGEMNVKRAFYDKFHFDIDLLEFVKQNHQTFNFKIHDF